MIRVNLLFETIIIIVLLNLALGFESTLHLVHRFGIPLVNRQTIKLVKLPKTNIASNRLQSIKLYSAISNTLQSARKQVFSRTNRVDGLNKWLNEFFEWKTLLSITGSNKYLISTNNQANVSCIEIVNEKTDRLLEQSKELLYSGIPEQALELYSKYVQCLLDRQLNCVLPTQPDFRFVIVAIRSHIMMHNIEEALVLLQAYSRKGYQFYAENKCQILSELALSSPQGLRAAIQFRKVMMERKEAMNINCCLSLLKGIRLHGLIPRFVDRTLLTDSIENVVSHDSDISFHLSDHSADEIALDILQHFFSQKQTHKSILKLLKEYFKLTFYITKANSNQVDIDFNEDTSKNVDAHIIKSLNVVFHNLERYNISTWDLDIANILFDGCLSMIHQNGNRANFIHIHTIFEAMRSQKLYCDTNTCNVLLKQYDVNGDGESAFNLLKDVMENSLQCQPNQESFKLILSSCLKTAKGRFYAQKLLDELSSRGKLEKHAWDSLLVLGVYEDDKFEKMNLLESCIWKILKLMILTGSSQPDSESMASLLRTFRKLDKHKHALELLYLLFRGESLRSEFSRFKESSVNVNATVSLQEFILKQTPLNNTAQMTILHDVVIYLPSPSKFIVSEVFESLKAAGDVDSSYQLLRSLSKIPISDTSSIKEKATSENDLSQRIIDVDMFSTAMETALKQKSLSLVFAIFALLEQTMQNQQPEKFVIPRRVYNTLIEAFGLQGDTSAAIGVFQELIQNYVPDVNSLHAVLRACLSSDLSDLRLAVVLLEELDQRPEINLDVYSKDILMLQFPDGLTLGRALMNMENLAHSW